MSIADREKYYKNYQNEVVDVLTNVDKGLKSVIRVYIRKLIDISEPYKASGRNFEFSAFSELKARVNSVLEEMKSAIIDYVQLNMVNVGNIANISNDVTEDHLLLITSKISENIGGKDLISRIDDYTIRLSDEIEAYISAGMYFDLKNTQIVDFYISNLAKPFLSKLMLDAFKVAGFKAKRIASKGLSVARGTYISSFNDIKRTAINTVFSTYAEAQQSIWNKIPEYVGWTTYRGSNFPCQVCDMEVGRLHDKSETYSGYHINCVCLVVPVFLSDLA